MTPGEFCGTLPGLEAPITDPKAWPAAVKAAPILEPYTKAGKPVRVEMAPLGSRTYTYPARVTLTKAEEEWLGASVVIPGMGEPWQVWSLAPERGYVWVVRDGDSRCVHTSTLELPGRRYSDVPEPRS